MKTIHSIILGILVAFTVYYYFIAIFLNNDKDDIYLATILGFVSLYWYQTGEIMKFKSLYEKEKQKNDDFVRGINEVKSLVHKALVNKN